MTMLVDLSQDVNELTPGMIAMRRELHQHPELAFEEVWTAATLAGRMKTLGLAVQEGIGGTGVLAMLKGGKPGKTLLIRSDIDALPMEDATGKAYASKLANCNHACGHDAHAAIVNWRNPFLDDFGLFMAAAPGCLMLLGTANPDKGITEIWHLPGFDIDEDALPNVLWNDLTKSLRSGMPSCVITCES
jgi:metal-dependent amidase/aminoacylase/carboxypeptidase family protein